MAITTSAKKALRQSETRAKRNLGYKKRMRELVKEVRSLVSQKKIKEAKKLLPQVYKTLDKIAKVGYIKKGNASRQKSRLTRLISKAGR